MPVEEKYRQQFKKGALEMVLLSVVARGKTYGYEIILTLNRRGGPLFQNIREGTLYPVLYRLEDAGLLTSEVLAPPGGRAKKYYRITDAGRRKLAQMQQFWQEYKRCIDDIMEV